MSEAQAVEFGQVQEAFARLHQAANQPSTRTPSGIIAKDAAREAMKRVARRLARIVQATPGVSEELKKGLGLRAGCEEHGPRGLPGRGPGLTVKMTMTRRVVLRLRDPDRMRVGKPGGVIGAMIFCQVGERPTMGVSDWTFVCNTTRTECAVNLPEGLELGSRVWFIAAWVDSRLRTGSWSAPAEARVLFASVVPGDGELPVAA